MKNSLPKLTFMLLAISIGVANGQMRNQPVPVPLAEQVRLIGGTSLLDPARFSISHGFSYSVGTGLLGGSQGIGVYTNNITYLVTDAVQLASQIYLVQPSMGTFGGNPTDGVALYYQTALNWRISDNITFNLGLSNLPRPQRYYGGMSPLSYMNRRQSLFLNPD